MSEYTDEQAAALNKAAERFIELYPLLAKTAGLLEPGDEDQPLYERVDQALMASVRTETDRSSKGRPAWHKRRRLATAETAATNWREMKQRALQPPKTRTEPSED